MNIDEHFITFDKLVLKVIKSFRDFEFWYVGEGRWKGYNPIANHIIIANSLSELKKKVDNWYLDLRNI